MRALAVAYFFVAAALAAFAVLLAYRLLVQFRQAWLFPYTAYLASWGALVLLAVVQYLLIGHFLPTAVHGEIFAAIRPLLAVVLAVALYFLSAFMAGLTGTRLSRTYTVVYLSVWAAMTVAVSIGSEILGDVAWGPSAASFAVFVLKTATIYGWIAYALLRTRGIADPLERSGVRRFVLLLLAGFIAFDLAVRDVTALVGVRTHDVAISLVQVGLNYPPLIWMAIFLRRRALTRPAEPLPADLKADLGALGLSVREREVVELVLLGLSHKEIGERLSISPDTVKKHTYNAYHKLGVQNRVQLSYFVQNRTSRRG